MAEGGLEELVAEYLEARGFSGSHAAFQSERQLRRRTPTPGQGAALQSDFVVALECGERAAFFELWDSHIPSELRAADPIAQNLEFSLSIFFATFPHRSGTGDGKQTMAEFKGYLETRGAVLAQSPEFATYCALPYIPDPSQHPFFNRLFTDAWPAEVKARLLQFLRLSLPKAHGPRLLTLYLDSCDSVAGVSVQALQRRLAESERDNVRRMSDLQSNYHTLVGIAMELVAALESAVAGRMITPEYIRDMCARLFGGKMPPSMDFQRSNTSTSVLRASVLSLRQSVPTITAPSSTSTLTPLNCTKVKTDVRFSSDTRKALLLQALRWRITRSPAGPKRSEVVTTLIQHDILGCSSDNEYQASVLQLLASSPALVKEHLTRFVNALSSLSWGRCYLTSCPAFIRGLCSALMSEQWDSHTRRNALGAVQKLSLRRTLQTLMIDTGLPQWVLGLLQEPEGLSEYTLRYSLALLMNLCLRTAGKEACIAQAAVAMKTLSELLEHEDQEICSYVNGILYSLLAVPDIRDEARSMGMGDLLASALHANPPELQSQLRYIVRQLESDGHTDYSDSGDEEEDEEEDPDLVEGDEEEAAVGEDLASGEALLAREYLALTPSQQPHTPSQQPPTPSQLHPTASQRLNSPLQLSQLITVSVASSPTPIKNTKLLDAPYVRPVTPQTVSALSRPQTATIPGSRQEGPEGETIRHSISSTH